MRARTWACVALLAIAWLSSACQLRRPDTVAARTIEPQLVEPEVPASTSTAANAAGSTPLRLLDTQASPHIGRRLLHREANGEIVEDAVWLWSSTPDRYLDMTLRLELMAGHAFRLVDLPGVPTLAATLIVWQLEPEGQSQLTGAVEFEFTDASRAVHTFVVRASEPVPGELPGQLAAASGRLLHRLASDGLAQAARER